MEKNVMRSMELVGRERMEVAVSLTTPHLPFFIVLRGLCPWILKPGLCLSTLYNRGPER